MSCTVDMSRPASPLMLADQLLTMAQVTDRAGFAELARRLVGLALDVLEPRATFN